MIDVLVNKFNNQYKRIYFCNHYFDSIMIRCFDNTLMAMIFSSEYFNNIVTHTIVGYEDAFLK